MDEKSWLAKRAAAERAVDSHLKDNLVVGIGSGSTIIPAVQRIKEIVSEKNWRIQCVPTSLQAKHLIAEAKLPLADLSQYNSIDVTFDGADEIDIYFAMIKGGGGAHCMEKILGHSSRKFIILVDESKPSRKIGTKWKKGIPIEVLGPATSIVAAKLRALGGKPEIRQAKMKAGPVVTDNGLLLMDVQFDTPIDDPRELHDKIVAIPGVLETGLFYDCVSAVYIGHFDGSVTEVTNEEKSKMLKIV